MGSTLKKCIIYKHDTIDNYHALESTTSFVNEFTAACLQVMSFFWAFNYEHLAIRDSDLISLRRE